jgi:hypothetical protein
MTDKPKHSIEEHDHVSLPRAVTITVETPASVLFEDEYPSTARYDLVAIGAIYAVHDAEDLDEDGNPRKVAGLLGRYKLPKYAAGWPREVFVDSTGKLHHFSPIRRLSPIPVESSFRRHEDDDQ